MGQQVQHGFVGPPCFQVISLVLREATIVQDAELRPRGRERQRIGFAAIIEARPIEQPAKPRPLIVELPAALDAVEQAVGTLLSTVDGRHATIPRIVEIDAARAATRSLLAAKSDALRIACAVFLHGVLQDVVIASHIHRFHDGRSATRGGAGQTRGIETMAELAHGCSDATAEVVPFDAPFLVADTPENNAWMVAVAMNHRSELVPLVVVHTRETVLLKHEHAQSVAGVEEFRCSGIMARTNGIASH